MAETDILKIIEKSFKPVLYAIVERLKADPYLKIIVLLFAIGIASNLLLRLSKLFFLKSKARLNGKDTVKEVTIDGISIGQTGRSIGDFYKDGRVVLNSKVYSEASVYSATVAAHESGHAMQDIKRYPSYVLRDIFAVLARISFAVIIPVSIIAGIIGGMLTTVSTVLLGIIIFSNVITLINEISASMWALIQIRKHDIVSVGKMWQSLLILMFASLTYLGMTSRQFLGIGKRMIRQQVRMYMI